MDIIALLFALLMELLLFSASAYALIPALKFDLLPLPLPFTMTALLFLIPHSSSRIPIIPSLAASAILIGFTGPEEGGIRLRGMRSAIEGLRWLPHGDSNNSAKCIVSYQLPGLLCRAENMIYDIRIALGVQVTF